MEGSKADARLSQRDFIRLLLCKIGTFLNYRSQPSSCKFIHVFEDVFYFFIEFHLKSKKRESRADMFVRADGRDEYWQKCKFNQKKAKFFGSMQAKNDFWCKFDFRRFRFFS